MDVCRFINSKNVAEHLRAANSRDMADYLRAENFPFTAQQAAYLANISTQVTLAEKTEAWHAIADEMSNERISAGKGRHDSARELIHAHIADMEKALALFMDNVGATYFPYESRWSKLPS